MSNHLPPALKARALHAAHAVTLGALMLTGCPKTNTIVDDTPKESVNVSKNEPSELTLKDASTDEVADTGDASEDARVDQGVATGDASEDARIDQGVAKCDMTKRDNVCPPNCSHREDADCCTGYCAYNAESQSCGCVIIGPFRAPEMPV